MWDKLKLIRPLPGATVTVTGETGDFYRVFVRTGGSLYYDWMPKSDFTDEPNPEPKT